MALIILILGLAIFVANHLFIYMPDARTAAIARLGRPAYHILFGLVSLAGVALIVWGFAVYRAQGMIVVWSPPAFMRHVTIGLMLIASVLLVAQFVPSQIKAKVKFPALAAVKTWAFAHLLANGDLGAILLFGALLAWAVYAFAAARHRKNVLPVAPAGWRNEILALVAGIVLFLTLGYAFHPYVIGVPVFRV